MKNETNTEEKTLSIFCFDSVAVHAKVTFDSYEMKGVQVTYWAEDTEDLPARIDSIFDVLFEEVIKNRQVDSGIINT